MPLLKDGGIMVNIISEKKPRKINLALQGGGAHGAFTWGVLDRLLEEESLVIEGISGTSAGAVNGAIVAAGIVAGGPQKARDELAVFWEMIGTGTQKALPFLSVFHAQAASFAYLGSFSGLWLTFMSRLFSPYELNPLNYNPLREFLQETIDFECLRETKKVKLYVSATNVETNRIKVFDNSDICPESLMASLSLPTLHQAVRWKDEFFWDGGFLGNPILEPLIYNCSSKDLMIIQVNPINRKGIPKTVREILDRVNEVTFNASLIREIRNIVNIQKLSDINVCTQDNPYKDLRLHKISDEAFMSELGFLNKFNTEPSFLETLKEKGRAAATQWIEENLDNIGLKTTMDLSHWQMETPSTTCLTWEGSLRNNRPE
jgi:NTE family protein